MLKFFKVLDQRSLDAEVVRKVKVILQEVDQFSIKLLEGSVTLDQLAMLREEGRIERLVTLHESLAEFRKPTLETRELKTAVVLRIEELEAYHRAAEDVKNFKLKFDLKNQKKNTELEQTMSQFSVDPSKVAINSVCKIRTASLKQIVLTLRHISTDHLVQVRRHTELFKTSEIFRQIHAKVVRDESRYLLMKFSLT